MNNNTSKTRRRIRRITVVGILSAISIALNYTPFAFMVVPGLQVQITLMHIPVIIGAILEGPIVGALVGLMFGLFSLYTATITPMPIAFAFLNPLVSVLPRILIGVGAYYAFAGLQRVFNKKKLGLSAGLAAAIGSLINTIGVLGMIYVLYAERFLEALGLANIPAAAAIFGLSLPNAPLELVAAVLITIPVVVAVNKIRK